MWLELLSSFLSCQPEELAFYVGKSSDNEIPQVFVFGGDQGMSQFLPHF